MNNLASYLQSSQVKRNKLITQGEFKTLLNAFQNAAVVFEKANSAILLANNLFNELSLFPVQELVGNSLQVLFDNFSTEEILTGENINLQLNRKGKNSVFVRVKFFDLDLRGGIYVAVIFPIDEIMQESSGYWENFTHGVTLLTQLTEATDLPSALASAVEITQKLIDADIVSIYSASSDYPLLRRRNTIDPTGKLPETLPSSDLSRLSKFSIWLPGRRVITEIQKLARTTHLSYLGSIPLGQEGAYHGMLVIGSLEKKPTKFFNVLMGIIGANISSVLSRHIYTSNVRQWMEEKQSALSLLKFIFENSQEGLIVLSPDLKVQEINLALEAMLGYSNLEVIDQPVENILIGADLLPRALESAVHGVPTFNIGNVMLHHRNGQSLLAQLRIFPLFEEGNISQIVLFINDVSEQEKIMLKTQQLEHRAFLGEFTSVFAHEVKNPVNNISSGVQLLGSKFKPEDANQVILKRLEDDCDRLEHLMDSFLSFSKSVDADRFERIDINQLLRRILDKWQPRFSHVQVKNYFEPGETIPAIRGDRRSLERVFINLFSNAVTAMEKTGGALSVKTSLSRTVIDSPQVEIIVSDNGPGIPDEIKKKIFEPFVTTNEQGTGLGLSITKKILTDHRGSISVNTFPGGTIFHIYLPACNGDDCK